MDRKAPVGLRRPSLTLKINPSEVSRKVLRAVDRWRGRERERYPETYKHDIRAPWPQPSPWSPEGLPPTVLHVPPKEVYDFLAVIASRASRTLWTGSPGSIAYALRNPGLEPISDDEFVRICTDSTFAWHLHPRLRDEDRRVFAPILARRATEEGLYRVECGAMEGVATLPGIHVAGTVALLARGPDGIAPLGIRMGDRLYTPDGGGAWELMKYYVLQGCAMQIFFLTHPRTHFPYDSIAAITQVVLPPEHRLRRLLTPHFGFQLAQDFAALYVTRSVAHNNQHELYTPFPTQRRGFFLLMERGYAGFDDNDAYPRWTFKLGSPHVELEYGRFLSAYHDAIAPFVKEALAGVSAADPAVARWADECARFVRGFPDARRIAADDLLVALVTTIIHNVSVVHTADHHSLMCQPPRKVSLRLRVPPPEPGAPFVLDRRALVTREDLFRYHLGRQMYVQAHVVTPLGDIDYDLGDGVPPGTVERFREALRGVDRPEWEHFAPLRLIASSIQF